MFNKIFDELVKAHEELSIEELRSLAFYAESVAQDREIAKFRESEEENRKFFYTGE